MGLSEVPRIASRTCLLSRSPFLWSAVCKPHSKKIIFSRCVGLLFNDLLLEFYTPLQIYFEVYPITVNLSRFWWFYWVFELALFNGSADGAISRHRVGNISMLRCRQRIGAFFGVLSLFVDRINKRIVAVLAGKKLVLHRFIVQKTHREMCLTIIYFFS